MKGRTEPDKYLSIILDGMDQKKTELPHYLYLSSFVSSLWKLKTHLVGVIVHGIGNYGFFDYYQYPHGSNLTIHCLLSTLYMQKDSLPDTLYLQMDNCARENKNRYILGFLCLLVEKDIFKKVKLSFLMVGHTHEDIDQMFSRFSVRLRRTPAMTLDKLMSIFEKCTTPKPLSVECDNVYNVTEWLQEYLNPISGQSRPHVFRITKGETGKAEICWKNWTTDKEYNKSIGDLPHLLKAIPDGSPNCLQESFEKIDVEVLKRDIEKAAPFFPKPEERQWWTSFFEKIGTI
ncbi:uncharacterized protein LOC128550076 [Mercenaria mercenaria]|uniref:uncharacterized protein LOC128550076 n=1 Tax=Mercenaria mercenaria TaxID=6596 RepID=UPI00234FA9F0|nr:uncharacterized protein LOC128550076 [Mercenaria mercenaria]